MLDVPVRYYKKYGIESSVLFCPRFRVAKLAVLCPRCEYFVERASPWMLKCSWEEFDDDGGMNVEAAEMLKKMDGI